MSRLGALQPLPLKLDPRLSMDQLLWIANLRHGPAGHWFARVREDRGDHDHLADPADAVEYLGRHRVPVPDGLPGPAEVEAMRTIREAIRSLLDPGAPDWTPDARTLLAGARFVAAPEGGIRSDAEGWPGFVADLLLPLVQLVRLRKSLRVCGNPHCRLVFLDVSPNGSRRWCDDRGCGNRDRVGRYRARADT